ncbi:E3 ubiquitin-protein ligase pellino homolog 3 isoform X1 [Ornithorhynchus anatinus]|uniref:E3 ubiquitin-protein ligase pellino homolog 3 isoform X1 n=1 Tax=Ornithorhynchus anatinus TaxID=9258 RepID=UPI0010A7AE0E|nr:E3 ubiquitin-protein ligase pellino homolog 3 isoform X1 [Ornithorhynchus anatinus]
MVLEGSAEAGPPGPLELRRPGSKPPRILPAPGGESLLVGKEPVKYGELIVLGYNGSLASGDKGRRRSRLALGRRPKANGVKPDVIHHISTPLVSKALSNRGQHSISYTLSRSHSVIVEYTHDNDTDMFQIGRSTENMIDFVVTDTAPGGGGGGDGPSAQSTISRYACRVICERWPPYTARIYAAGFDASSNIFLGVRAGGKMADPGRVDGRTDHQRGAGDAPGRGLLRGLGPRGLAGDLRLRQRLHPEGQSLRAAAREAGGERIQRAAGRLPDRPVRGHPPVAHAGRPAPGPDPEAAGGPAAGGQRGPPAVPRGAQHPGLPQPGPRARRPRQTAALGLRALRPRPRLPRLGLPAGAGPPGARVSPVPPGGALRAPVAGPRGRPLPGPRPPQPRLRPLRPRLLREDGPLLGPDPAAARHPRLPRRLPLLRGLAHGGARLRPTHLPGAAGLAPGDRAGRDVPPEGPGGGPGERARPPRGLRARRPPPRPRSVG